MHETHNALQESVLAVSQSPRPGSNPGWGRQEHLWLEGRHAGDVEQGGELDGALRAEVHLGSRVHELLEGLLEELCILWVCDLQCTLP